VAALALPTMLDTAWVLVTAYLFVIPLAIRTGLEDQMLRGELVGYLSYAGRLGTVGSWVVARGLPCDGHSKSDSHILHHWTTLPS